MTKPLNKPDTDSVITYEKLSDTVCSVLAILCHKPAIDKNATLGDLDIDNELTFCTELELALKQHLNKFFRNGFDFRQRFYSWDKHTPVQEMLRCLAWQYGVKAPGVPGEISSTRQAINNALVQQQVK